MKASGLLQEYKVLRHCLPPQVLYIVPLPYGHLCAKPYCHQVSLLVLCVSTEDEVFRGNCLLWGGVPEIPAVGEELWHLAVLQLPKWHPHVPGTPWPDHSLQAPSPSADETWKPGTVPMPAQSRSWRWRKLQPASAADWQSSSSTTPRSSSFCPTRSFLANTATLHHQET